MRIIINIALLIVVFGGVLWTTKVINGNLSYDSVKTIFDVTFISDSVTQHQRDAVYLPYRMRLIFFNKSIYLFQILRNIFNFWTLSNINSTILLANLYPIYLGFKDIYNKRYYGICWMLLLFGSIAIGINKMVDARSAVIFLLPLFCLLFWWGMRKTNWKLYSIFLIISLCLLF